MTRGWVFDLQRLSVHDGPGIRTTVFLKGCPLHCAWCHNPESQDPRPVLAFYENLCIGCGECLKACPRHCHENRDGIHRIDRKKCIACGQCVKTCTGALKLLGREMEVSEVLKEVLRDRSFYEASGGGMTLSGGEPFSQPEFALALLEAAKREGLHTAVETTGLCSAETLLKAQKHTDLFLYDFKESRTDLHRKYTGAGNEKILENLRALDNAGGQIILRCIVIPGINDRPDHFEAIAALAQRLKNVRQIHLEPYNNFGIGKAACIGETYPLEEITPPEEETVQTWVKTVQSLTDVETLKS